MPDSPTSSPVTDTKSNSLSSRTQFNKEEPKFPPYNPQNPDPLNRAIADWCRRKQCLVILSDNHAVINELEFLSSQSNVQNVGPPTTAPVGTPLKSKSSQSSSFTPTLISTPSKADTDHCDAITDFIANKIGAQGDATTLGFSSNSWRNGTGKGMPSQHKVRALINEAYNKSHFWFNLDACAPESEHVRNIRMSIDYAIRVAIGTTYAYLVSDVIPGDILELMYRISMSTLNVTSKASRATLSEFLGHFKPKSVPFLRW